jgi:hypothetical protein
VSTRHWRRTALRLLFRAARDAGLVAGDPTLDLDLPPRSSLGTRPLIDDEVALCRSVAQWSLAGSRRAAVWALAEATCRSSELPNISADDIDLDSGRVWISGGKATEPREGDLTDWGLQHVRARILELDEPTQPLVYSGRSPSGAGQVAGASALVDVLIRAGLHQEPDVRAGSVAAWAGRRVLEETGRIDLAARRRLGCGASTARRGSSAGTGTEPDRPTVRRLRLGCRRSNGSKRSLPTMRSTSSRTPVPEPDPTAGGRPRMFPPYMWLLYDALLSVWGSARRVEAELAHPIVWNQLRVLIAAGSLTSRIGGCPEADAAWHYLYGRTTWLTDPPCSPQLHGSTAARRHRPSPPARVCSTPMGPVPGPTRTCRGCSTPMARSSPRCSGEARHPDPTRQTGEVRTLRFEQDAGAALRRHRRDRVGHSSSCSWPCARPISTGGSSSTSTGSLSPGGEAACAMDTITRARPADAPGLQGVIYDGALRGVHHQRLLRDLGLLPINKVTAAKAGTASPAARTTNASRSRPTSKTAPSPDPTAPSAPSRCSPRPAPSASLTLTDTGERALHRTRRHPHQPQGRQVGTYRWYNTYRLPDHLGGGTSSSSASTATTRTRSGSSTAPRTSDPSRRPTRTSEPSTDDATTPSPSTAPSTTPSGSAEPTLVGHARQHLNLLTYALGVNASRCTATGAPAATRRSRSQPEHPDPGTTGASTRPTRPRPPAQVTSSTRDRAPSGRQPPA